MNGQCEKLINEIKDLLPKDGYEEIVDKCIALLSISPTNATYWYVFSISLTFSRHYEDAIYAIQNAIKFYSNSLNKKELDINALLFCLSHNLLMTGEWKSGFEAFESKTAFWKAPLFIHTHKAATQWKGEDISGKTLLIHHEGGLGDCIQFLRYIPYLKKLNCKLILFLRQELNCLFRHLDVEFACNDYHDYDAFVYIMSLPFCFKTEISTVPPPIEIDCIHRPVKGRIGIAWKSGAINSDFGFGKKNSELKQWADLFIIPNVHYVCLQKEVSEEEDSILAEHHIERHSIHSFIDTVKILETCEHVICVDTAVLHLAASMYIPTSVLLPFNACWRWLIDRRDSPWYPSVQLFRQKKINVWTDPLQEIEAHIRTLYVNKNDKKGIEACLHVT